MGILNSESISFNRWVHRFGMISGFILLAMMVCIPVVISIVYDIWPNFGKLIPSFISVSLLMIPFCFAECIAYPPIIGSGAVYMAYITGNTTALKMPCAISALNIAGVKQSTVEADAVSLVAVGASTLTVTVVILLGMLLAAPLSPILNSAVLKPGFANILPALFGALTIGTIMGKEKYFIAPFLAALGFALFTKVSSAYYMLIAIVISLIVGWLMDPTRRAAKVAESGK